MTELRLYWIWDRNGICEGRRQPGHHGRKCKETGRRERRAGTVIWHKSPACCRRRERRLDNETAVQNVVKQAVDTFGRIDVLINNAQASASGVTLEDHTTEQFDLAVYSGLYAVFYYMKACYPYLKETRARSSISHRERGCSETSGQCAYAAAKEGIRGLTRVAATEWGPDGINVNIVCPLALDGTA